MPFRWTINPYRGCSHACVFCFAAHPHVPRLQRGRGLREADRRQGQRARARAGRDAAAVVEARARRARDEHRPVPVGRRPLQAHAGIWEAFRDSRTPCSVLTKSPLVTRDVALLKEMSDMGLFSAAFSVPDDRREGLARQRAAHAQPLRPARGRGRAQPQRDRGQRARRAAHARHQRRPAPGRADPRAGRGGRRRERQRHPPPPARRGQGHHDGLARVLPARPGPALRAPVRPWRLRADHASATA